MEAQIARNREKNAETIVAISSPPGRSLRGLIRLSGPEAATILGSLVHPSPSSRDLIPVHLKSPPIPAWAIRFDAPRSYTGQCVAELQVPGHPALLDRLLHQTIAAGARLAEPGEFTFRAYTAGKIDLIRAEGIAATITAESQGQLRAAKMLRRGMLGSLAAEIVEIMGQQLALVEAGIDFVDQEDVVPIAPKELDKNLNQVRQRLAELLDHSRSWGTIEAVPRTVLVGPPSCGKSTLFNALLGRQRAVVDPQPGTTRDVLEESLQLTDRRGRDIETMLVDIAGLDRPDAALDRQIQRLARRAIERADLLLIVNGSESSADVLKLHLHTKSDLGPGPGLNVSARTGHNLNTLRAAIAERLGDRGISVAADSLVLQPRHEAALRATLEAIDTARRLLEPDKLMIESNELVASHLRSALDELAGLGGQLTPDDVIGRVFATFCVGK